jgi:hypothetical protein
VADGQAEVVAGGPQALVVAGLAGQIREQVPQPLAGEPQPVALGAGTQQDLGDCQADQFGIRQPRPAAWAEPWPQQLIDGDLQCDDEVVETGVHGASQEVDVATATPTLGGLVFLVTAQHHRTDSESTI